MTIENFDLSKRKLINDLMEKFGKEFFNSVDEFLVFAELFDEERNNGKTVNEFMKRFPKPSLLFLAIDVMIAKEKLRDGFTIPERKLVNKFTLSVGANLIKGVFSTIFGK